MYILYNIGDSVTFTTSEYDASSDSYTDKKFMGYIFAIEISQEGVFSGKRGYSVRYKVRSDFEGISNNWCYAQQSKIVKLGEHKNAKNYRECR